MNRALLAFTIWLITLPAFAQSTAPVLLPGGCGTGNLTNSLAYPTVDINGRLCGSFSPAPSNSVTASNTGTTAAVAASIPAVANKTAFICGWSIDADATAATVGTATITGTVSGTLTRRQSVAAAASGTAATWGAYTPCIPASAVNTAITVTSAAAGAGGNTAVDVWGYYQ